MYVSILVKALRLSKVAREFVQAVEAAGGGVVHERELHLPGTCLGFKIQNRSESAANSSSTASALLGTSLRCGAAIAPELGNTSGET